MTVRDIIKILRNAGWEIIEGKKHHLAIHKDHPGKKVPIPRHKGDIPIGTAQAILKQAGIED